MSKYRIVIEKIDYNNNLLLQSQAEITSEHIQQLEKYQDIDALEETFKQLKNKFKQNEQNQSR